MKEVKQISPSLMCGNWLNFEETIHVFEEARIDWLHIDMMDNHFVHNLSFAVESINQIKQLTDIPLDIHMMIEHPKNLMERMILTERDAVTFHYEIEDDIDELIDYLTLKGVKVGLALRPSTPVIKLLPYLSKLDIILLMNTEPGFFGKAMSDGAMDKIEALKKLIDDNGADIAICVDGSVSYELAGTMKDKGANIFVAGTSSIFKDKTRLLENIELFRNILGIEV